jgi:hypothetical protein
MIVTGNYEQAKPHRKAVTILTGDVFGRTDIIAGGGPDERPHAYLVEQSPGVSLPTHFHMTDQFQVVVSGSGMMGRSHKLAPLTVHFARGKTGYGPIVAGGEGLAYLTLRPRVEYGAHYFSDPRTQVDRKAPKFQATSEIVPMQSGVVAATPARALIAPDDSGLSAWLSSLTDSQAFTSPSAGPAGRFHVVAAGAALVNGERLPPWSCLWVSAGQVEPHIEACLGGAEILTLQFPGYSLFPPPLPAGASVPT